MQELANQVENVEKGTRVSPRIKGLLAYAASAVMTLLILEGVLKLYAVDLSIPFCYGGDNLWDLQVMKDLINKEWSLFSWIPRTTRVGAPFGSSLADFPGWADAGQIYLVIKFLSFFTKDYFRADNLFCLFTYFATGFSALYAFRYYKMPYGIALVFSALYNFLPYHMMRVEWGHPLLSSYFEIPLMSLIIIWTWSRRPIFFKREDGRYKLDFKNHKAAFSTFVCIISALSNIYYNFFFLFLAFVAGVRAALYRKSWHHLMTPFILLAIVVASVSITVAPYIKHRIVDGVNTEAGVRSYIDAERFGFRITQLLLPVDGHRIKWLADLKEKYNVLPFINENKGSTLGIVSSIGLLGLLLYFLFTGRSQSQAYYKLGMLSICAILLGTMGGLSSLLSVLAFSYFRCSNRISLFIAFFSLLALAFAINRYQRRLPRWSFYMGLFVILFVGLYDQVPQASKFNYDYETKRNEYMSDQQFMQEIEKAAPKDALIFQLPYVGFPEGPNPDGVYFYDHFKGYLHSNDLYWSFGSVRGTYGGVWYQSTAESPLDQMLFKLSVKGFAGIYIDRQGYSDKAASLEAGLSQILQRQPLVSKNERLSYFDMTAYRAAVLKNIDAGKLEYLKDPTRDDWFGDFSRLERNEQAYWRWCGKNGELWLSNPSSKNRKERLYMEFYPVRQEPYEIIIQGNDFSDRIRIDRQIEKYERVVNAAAHGKTLIRFHSDAEPLHVLDDPRTLVFAVYNFDLKNMDDAR